MRKLALLIAAPLLLATACSAAQAPSATAQGRGGEGVGMPVPAPAADAASGYTGVASTTTNQGIPTVVVSADRNLILTAKIDMRSKDPWATSDRAQAIATARGRGPRPRPYGRPSRRTPSPPATGRPMHGHRRRPSLARRPRLAR